MVGPTVQHRSETGAVWSDHVDIRPTILSMVGLGSESSQDGGAIAQLFVPKYLPQQVGNHIDVYSPTRTSTPQAWRSLITQAQALIGDMPSLSQMSTPPPQPVCG
jgi:hypothetical protein